MQIQLQLQQIQLQIQLSKLILRNKYTIPTLNSNNTEMRNVMNGCTYIYHDFPFIPFHYTYAPFTNSPQFTFLHVHFPSLHFTSVHFGWFPPHFLFALFITFLILFLKLLGFRETVPRATAGSWFQGWMVLLTKEYFPISVFCFLLLIFLSWSTLLR
jgi:hypothetical protein